MKRLGARWRPCGKRFVAISGQCRTDYYPRGATGHFAGRPEGGEWDLYIEYQNRQLAELLTNYGAIGGIWLDGWVGSGNARQRVTAGDSPGRIERCILYSQRRQEGMCAARCGGEFLVEM